MTGESRGNSLEGVIYSQVQSISVEYDEDKGGEAFVRSEDKRFKFTGTGQSTNQGVININFNDSATPLVQMTK